MSIIFIGFHSFNLFQVNSDQCLKNHMGGESFEKLQIVVRSYSVTFVHIINSTNFINSNILYLTKIYTNFAHAFYQDSTVVVFI